MISAPCDFGKHDTGLQTQHGYLVPMQAPHAAFHFRGSKILDVFTLRILDEDACKQAHQIGAVEQSVVDAQWHVFAETLGQMIAPSPVLMAHMLVLSSIFFLAALEETHFTTLSDTVAGKDFETYTL